MASHIIGIDFDNTIIRYDEVAYEVARDLCALPARIPHEKTAVRDFIRASPGGDELWQRVQGQMYGVRILGARMAEGFPGFIRACRAQNLHPVIVSHKTQFGHFDESRTDLRAASLRWMEAHAFFTAAGLGFGADDVYFESTRADKLKRIAELRCAVFIDDLLEVFIEPEFPAGCVKILYSPTAPEDSPQDVKVLESWERIAAEVPRCAWDDILR